MVLVCRKCDKSRIHDMTAFKIMYMFDMCDTLAFQLKVSMPPFGVEREEAPKSKRLPFLSQKSHDPVRASTSASGPFGSEGCESSEPLPHRPSKSIHPRNLPQQSLVLFGSEPDEDEAEPGSSGESNDGFDYEAYRGKSQTVFSVGWQSLLDLKKASFWKDSGEPQPKKKRKYNNASRSATASYSRKNSSGQFKQNGIDPEKIGTFVWSNHLPLFLGETLFNSLGLCRVRTKFDTCVIYTISNVLGCGPKPC